MFLPNPQLLLCGPTAKKKFAASSRIYNQLLWTTFLIVLLVTVVLVAFILVRGVHLGPAVDLVGKGILKLNNHRVTTFFSSWTRIRIDLEKFQKTKWPGIQLETFIIVICILFFPSSKMHFLLRSFHLQK